MNSNWAKSFFKMTGVQYGEKLLLKGIPVLYKAKGASLRLGKMLPFEAVFSAIWLACIAVRSLWQEYREQ